MTGIKRDRVVTCTLSTMELHDMYARMKPGQSNSEFLRLAIKKMRLHVSTQGRGKAHE